MRGITRIEGVGINTVTRLPEDAGAACAAHHHEHVRNVPARRIQVDELWAFTYAKQRHVGSRQARPGGCRRYLDVGRHRRGHQASDHVVGRSAGSVASGSVRGSIVYRRRVVHERLLTQPGAPLGDGFTPEAE